MHNWKFILFHVVNEVGKTLRAKDALRMTIASLHEVVIKRAFLKKFKIL